LIEEGIHHASTNALICLKAKAYLDISERISNGSNEDLKQTNKHKGDVFRLAVMLTQNDSFTLPKTIQTDMQAFANAISFNLPDKAIYKEMGLGNTNVEMVFDLLIRVFNLSKEV
jgi:hypothetical protein